MKYDGEKTQTIIGPNVEIGENTVIQSHVNISGNVKIGKGNKIYPFVSINDPQDLKYAGEPTNLIIGDNNKIREYVTINPGTIGGGGKTVIGNNCLFMISSHIAHDCIVGNNVVMANLATLGGHVEIDDWANIGGGVMVHQFVKVGTQSLIGGGFTAKQDVPPYIIVSGAPLRFVGINKIGLERRGFGKETREIIKQAYRKYFVSKLNRGQAIDYIKRSLPQIEEIKNIVEFIDSSERGII